MVVERWISVTGGLIGVFGDTRTYDSRDSLVVYRLMVNYNYRGPLHGDNV